VALPGQRSHLALQVLQVRTRSYSKSANEVCQPPERHPPNQRFGRKLRNLLQDLGSSYPTMLQGLEQTCNKGT
jgi:hypothetical protein